LVFAQVRAVWQGRRGRLIPLSLGEGAAPPLGSPTRAGPGRGDGWNAAYRTETGSSLGTSARLLLLGNAGFSLRRSEAARRGLAAGQCGAAGLPRRCPPPFAFVAATRLAGLESGEKAPALGCDTVSGDGYRDGVVAILLSRAGMRLR